MAPCVLITAGASGIGLEFACAFAPKAKGLVCDINGHALDDVATKIPGVITKVCDISKRKDIEEMVAYDAREFTLQLIGSKKMFLNQLNYIKK